MGCRRDLQPSDTGTRVIIRVDLDGKVGRSKLTHHGSKSIRSEPEPAVPPVEADAAGVARFVVGDGDVPVAGTSTCKALVQIFRPPWSRSNLVSTCCEPDRFAEHAAG
jgi:hypothetical protein